MDLKCPGYQDQRIHLADLGRDPMIKLEPDPFRPPEQRAPFNWLDPQNRTRFNPSIRVDLAQEFWNIGLQFVLQMRETNLSPSSPSYDGEPYHIVGQSNERICATAHYIYSSTNITPATLSFRCRISPEEAGLAKGEIDTPPFAPEIYGARDGDPAIQTLGSVNLKESRTIVYPNTFQTKLSPFTLAEPSKPGHLRILTLHLVDPNRRIMSTGKVPCQRRDWWADAVRNTCPIFHRLPREVWDKIVASVSGYPISMDEALVDRKEFLDEREEFRRQHTKSMDDYLPWNLRGYDEDEE